MKGYIKLHREYKDHPIIGKDTDHFHVWLHLMLEATWKEIPMKFGNEIITLQPGQLITGIKALSEESGVQKSKVQRILKLFTECNIIDIQTNNKGSLITLLDWNSTQTNDTPMTQERHANDMPMTPNKKKEERTKKKELERGLARNKKLPFVAPTLEEVKAYYQQNHEKHCKELNKEIDIDLFFCHYASLGWNGIKDWKACFDKWVLRERPKIPTQVCPPTYNAFHNFTERSYDFDALEEKLFCRSSIYKAVE